MDYSQILILLDKATKEFYYLSNRNKHDEAQKNAEQIVTLGHQLVEANRLMRERDENMCR